MPEGGDPAVTLRERVHEAIQEISHLSRLTWGNASAIDREAGLVYIKPSGVMPSVGQVSVVTVDGEHREGLKPSTDTPTHRVLYCAWPQIGGIVHTHSPFATSWAQAGKPIPCLGTTHADHFRGPIPVTEFLSAAELESYEESTGRTIVQALDGSDPLETPAILLRGHGPFVWGDSVEEAVANAVALEELAKLAILTLQVDPSVGELPDGLREKHFRRKHGAGNYYGQ